MTYLSYNNLTDKDNKKETKNLKNANFVVLKQ